MCIRTMYLYYQNAKKHMSYAACTFSVAYHTVTSIGTSPYCLNIALWHSVSAGWPIGIRTMTDYVYAYTYIHTCMHAYITLHYITLHYTTLIHTYMHACMHAYRQTDRHIHIHKHIHIHMYPAISHSGSFHHVLSIHFASPYHVR